MYRLSRSVFHESCKALQSTAPAGSRRQIETISSCVINVRRRWAIEWDLTIHEEYITYIHTYKSMKEPHEKMQTDLVQN